MEDIESLNILREINPDTVINTAAYHITSECESNPLQAFEVNAIGQRNVAIICKEIHATCIYISTDYVFDGSKGKAYTENDIPSPLNVYGVSKLCGEIFTRNIADRYYIIRTASLFGIRGSRAKGGNFVDTVVEHISKGKEMKVVDDIIMSPTHTMDVAVAIKKLIGINAPWGIYHVVNTGATSWYDFAVCIADIIGVGHELIRPTKSDMGHMVVRRPKNSSLSTDKLQGIGINMPPWKVALKTYMKAKGYL